MKRIILTTTLILSLGIAGHASAGHRGDKYQRHNQSFEDSARVIKVKPIFETLRINHPEQRCWNEKVHRRSSRHNDSYTSPLIGAIVGGVVGNQFGHKSGKTVMTVAGSLLGASIGSELAKNDRHRYAGGHHKERRCETIDNFETHEEIVGYRVKYRYNGRTYHTRMDRDPGDYLRIEVNIRPQAY